MQTALTTPTGAVTVDQLVARAEINDVLQRYIRGIDRVDMEVVSSCYHPGAYDDHGQFQGTVEEFTEWLSGRIWRLSKGMAIDTHNTNQTANAKMT